MVKLSAQIKHLFSDQKTSSIVLFLAILSRLIQLVFFYNIRVDASYQVMATQNFVYGHGISTASVLPNDLSTIIYTPLINWPPGYSLLLAPFYALFNPNYIAAGLLLDFLAALTLIFVSRAILKLLNVPLYLINCYTLLTGFFIYYFYFIASSDAIAISVFMVALYYTLSLLKTGQYAAKQLLFLYASLLVCAWIKYLFIPVVFVIPAFLFFKGIVDKVTRLKKAGLWVFFGLLFGISLLLGYQKTVGGAAAYISQPERGFYPQHLLESYPFVPGSFLKPDTLGLLFGQWEKANTIILRLYQGVHLLLIFFLVGYLISHAKKRRLQLTLSQSYFYLVFFISLTVTLLLSILSLRVAKEEILPGWFWTYVEEPRYYGLPNVLLQLGAFVLFSIYCHKPSRYLKYIFGILIVFLVPDMFRGLVFDLNRIRLWGKEEYSWQYEDRFQKYAAALLKREQQKQPAEKIVITGTSYYMNHRVSLYSHAPILSEVNSINTLSSLNAKIPVLLLVILNEKELSKFQPFLAKKGNEVAGMFDGYYFYTIHVAPR